MGFWLEIVTLLIPGFNDSRDELTRLTAFVAERVARHPVARHGVPRRLQDDRARQNTTADMLLGRRGHRRATRACATSTPATCPARSATLEDTHCASCGETLVARYGYLIRDYRITRGRPLPVVRRRWSRAAGARSSTARLTVAARSCRARDRGCRCASVMIKRSMPATSPCVDRHCLETVRCATCACRSPTAATCAASTACRRTSTSGCRARTCCTSRRSARSSTSSSRSASTSCGSPAASRCSAATSRRSCACWRPSPGSNDLALTTNGMLLADQIDALKAAGLRRITVSLDTLHADRFSALDALRRARRASTKASPRRDRVFGGFKIDTVVIRGVNDDELVDLIEYGKSVNAEVRFIEYMDVGGATHWSPDRVVSRREMLARLSRALRPDRADRRRDLGAGRQRFALPDGTTFGIISSTTEPFCRSCDRSRLTADGMWYLCLYAHARHRSARAAAAGRQPGRARRRSSAAAGGAATTAAPRSASRSATGARSCRSTTLRKDPHLEMHTRGG